MSSKFWPDLALAPREHFFTAGSDTGDEGGADEDSEEALGRGEEGDEIDMDEEFEECGADSDNEDDEDDEEEEDIKEASGGKSKRVKHQRRVYIFGSVATLSIGQRKIEAKKLPRLVVTSTSFKGGAKKMISEMCRSLLKLKKGDSLKGNQDRVGFQTFFYPLLSTFYPLFFYSSVHLFFFNISSLNSPDCNYFEFANKALNVWRARLELRILQTLQS